MLSISACLPEALNTISTSFTHVLSTAESRSEELLCVVA